MAAEHLVARLSANVAYSFFDCLFGFFGHLYLLELIDLIRFRPELTP